MTRLIEIEGIGPAYAEKLEAAGLHTTEELLGAAGKHDGRVGLAARTGISERTILEWVNRADLMRVKGIGEEYADLLELAGVDSVPELAHRDPAHLVAKLAEVNEHHKAVRRLPTLGEVEAWVAQAKTMAAAVSH